jgi:hypothetical protein
MSSKNIILKKLKKSEETAKKNLIKAQVKAQIAYQMVQKAQQKYKIQSEKVEKMIKKIKDQKKSTKKSSIKKSTIKKSTTKKSTTNKKTKKSSKKGPMRGGGGSDWLNTVNSRGNVAGPDDHWNVPGDKWSSQFEKSGEYIPMSELRKGSYDLQKKPITKIPSGFDNNALGYEVISSSTLGDLKTQIGV